MLAVIPIIGMVVALLAGVPIAFALAGAGILGVWLTTGQLSAVINILGTAPYTGVSEYLLATVPMFLLMAFFTKQ